MIIKIKIDLSRKTRDLCILLALSSSKPALGENRCDHPHCRQVHLVITISIRNIITINLIITIIVIIVITCIHC